MSIKPARTSVPIHDIIARRWSGRAFDRSKPVARERLTALLEAARWAPSCFNDQPWRFLVWDRNRDETSWARAFACLGEWNQKWVQNAPLLLLALADSEFERNAKPNRWGQYDSGAAATSLCLQAAALGLVAHQMGGFDPDKARATFAIPERFSPMAMIALGYPASADVLEAEYRELELAERERKPLGERFYEGAWQQPYAP